MVYIQRPWGWRWRNRPVGDRWFSDRYYNWPRPVVVEAPPQPPQTIVVQPTPAAMDAATKPSPQSGLTKTEETIVITSSVVGGVLLLALVGTLVGITASRRH